MNKRHAFPRVLTALALAAAMPLAACGDDDEDSGGGGSSGGSAAATEVAFELSGSGKSAKMTAPKSTEGGTVKFTFQNASKKEGGAQLVEIKGDHTAKEALAAANAWGEKGKPLPEWVGLAGGLPNTKPGASSSATQTLSEGKYMVVDINSNAFAEFEVTGGGEGELPEPEGRIEAVDYSFKSSGLAAGKAEVTIDNTGKQPHFVVGLPIKKGKTIEDVKKFSRTEKGEPPFEEKAAFDTAVIDGGTTQVVELELKKGKYAFLCFIPDREGGPPHVAKGMVAEATVE